MRLTDGEQRMLEGKHGKAVAMAMSILTKLGEIYGAEEMLAISQAHIDGCSYKTIDNAGLEFVEKLVDNGAKFCVPTNTNPAGRDIKRWQEFRIPADFVERTKRVEQACLRMGAAPTWTCAPYHYGIIPRFGQQIAWAESNAVVYANSVIGARTARYGDFGDYCAAITGRAPKFSLHLSENRRGEVLLRLQPSNMIDLGDDSIYHLIGYAVGSIAQARIPVIDGIPSSVTPDQLKVLGTAAASSGAVGLFHVLGVTPEASSYKDAFQSEEPAEVIDIGEEELSKARGVLSTAKEGKVDLVIIGCPHSSFPEIRQLSLLIEGKKVARGVEFWVQTNRTVYYWLKEAGVLEVLNYSGVKVTTDSCILAWPLYNWEFKLMVTNSAKFAHYVPDQAGIQAIFGSLQECVEAAIKGEVRRI